jgi:hypothetical protein
MSLEYCAPRKDLARDPPSRWAKVGKDKLARFALALFAEVENCRRCKIYIHGPARLIGAGPKMEVLVSAAGKGSF